jgi:methylase of polypeptide subunit release factors
LTSRPSNDGALLVCLRERLQAAGYTGEGLRRLIGIAHPDDVGPLNRAPVLERLRAAPGPAATLARLFYLEEDESRAHLRAAIPAGEIDGLGRRGLLARRAGGSGLAARLRIDAVGDLHLLGDRRFRSPDPGALRLPRGDMVYPPGGDSSLLAGAIPAFECGTALDLCTGSGIQGIALARRARTVVAVDIGERAVALARINAAFNAVPNFSVRRGDLYGPVRGERFDLIVANPPFVPGPARGPAYHSGGPRGDRVLKRVVEGWSDHLEPGGRAFAVSHLALPKGGDVASAVSPWVRRLRGRSLALVLEEGTPIDLAAAQALFALDHGFPSYAAEVRRWVAYLRRHRVERIVLLLLAAERRGRRGLEVVPALQRALPLPLSRPAADHLAEWLA